MKNACKNLFAGFCAVALLAQCTYTAPQNTYTAPDVPEALKVDLQQNKLAFSLTATGYQIYVCQKDPANPDGPNKWILREPEADLFDAQNKKVGTHGKGPYWKSTMPNDTSKVTGILIDGKPKGKADSPSAGAIPWLLLDCKAAGAGMFAGVTQIQRLDTNGGRAPEACCDSTGCCNEVRVPYTATYYFYMPNK